MSCGKIPSCNSFFGCADQCPIPYTPRKCKTQCCCKPVTSKCCDNNNPLVICCPSPCQPCQPNPCQPCQPCQPNPCQPNPCQQQQVFSPCLPRCSSPCQSQSPCRPPCDLGRCPNVAYITSSVVATSVPTGGIAIPTGSTTIPGGTVTVITGYTGTPTTNIGGIQLNFATGQFTISCTGRYLLSISICFIANPTGTREVYIYKIDAITALISLLASDTRNATVTGNTCASVTTVSDLNTNDRIFFAVTQSSGAVLSTASDTSRYIITRLC